MAIFFDTRVNVAKGVVHVEVDWHKQFPLLAVASYGEDSGGIVTFFGDEGDKLPGLELPTQHNAQPTTLAWHPSRKFCCVGWENGEITLFNVAEKEVVEIRSLHRSPVCLLEWSSMGSRLISADTSGSLLGWKSDGRGSMHTVFHHELKDPLSQVVFRSVPSSGGGLDISGLARAAVDGDERALDMFSSWRPKTAGQKRPSFSVEPRENLGCFVGSLSGRIYYINEHGGCSEVLTSDGPIKRLLYHETRDLLVVVTEGMSLAQLSVDVDGGLAEISKVKLSGRAQDGTITWAGKGLLAVSGGDANVRLWNVDSGDNFVLSLDDARRAASEVVTSVSFSRNKGVLAVGTNCGRVAFWKHSETAAGRDSDAESQWTPLTPSSLGNGDPTAMAGAVVGLRWGTSRNALAANTMKDAFILKEHTLCAHFKDQMTVVQMSPTELAIVGTSCKTFSGKIPIHGVYCDESRYVAVWSRKEVAVYEIRGSDIVCRGAFHADCETLAVHEQSVYCIEKDKVQVRGFQGAVKQTLPFLEGEGEPTALDINGNFLVVASLTGVIKVWDLSRRDARPHAGPKNLNDVIVDFGEVISVRCNCTGTRVSISFATASLLPDPKLYVWDVESDTVLYFNFASGRGEDDDNSPPPNSAESTHSRDVTAADRAKLETARDVGGRFVLSQFWDAEEPRLVVVEAKVLPLLSTQAATTTSSSSGDGGRGRRKRTTTSVFLDSKRSGFVDKAEIIVVSMFATADSGGLVVQDFFPLDNDISRLLGVQTPFFYLLTKPECVESKSGKMVKQRVMRDFVGLEAKDKSVRDAMMNFSYFLCIGNMDEAFKAIKTIKSETVWENMAKMCVKSKRLDVAAVCLGNMGHARGARCLREMSVDSGGKQLPLDARAGVLALQLGMVDEAERLFRACGRFDLLNKVYQGSNRWAEALDTAADVDRIHLRTTSFNYARHLEAQGDISGAINYFEKSDTQRFEVPRMLFDDPAALEAYVVQSKDPALKKWWAQYLESTGEMEAALEFYESAKDALSLVRVHCYCGELETAARIANESGDRAACYHLARQYENNDMVREAIHFYTRAQAFANAMRICKENGMEDQLLSLGQLAGPKEQIDAARHFENMEKPQLDKAIVLYHRAGLLSKALDLAFKAQKYSELQMIALDLDSNTDPATLDRCVKFFIENRQFDKATNLLAVGKRYFEALDLCVEHNIPITEEIADRMTIERGEEDEAARVKLLEKIGECAFEQGDYRLATKKFTQAGNKMKAMKALLKSGDTEKITFFANVSRERDIYVMAANYLQSLDWRKDPSIMKNIITFYNKGKALDLLAGFYVACAQVEIDEYQNYEKALEAYTEAYKTLTKAYNGGADIPQVDEKLEQIKQRAELVQRFVQIRRLYEDNPSQAIAMCKQLVSEPDAELAIRRGDVYGLMVEYFAQQRQYQAAHGIINEMRSRLPNLNLAYYVNAQTLDAVSKAVGVQLGGIGGRDAVDDDDDSGQSDEEIEEEEEDNRKKPMPSGFYGSSGVTLNGRIF